MIVFSFLTDAEVREDELAARLVQVGAGLVQEEGGRIVQDRDDVLQTLEHTGGEAVDSRWR